MTAQVEEVNMNLIMGQHIIPDMEGSTQKEILHTPAEIAFHEGKVSDMDTFSQELCKREQEYTTGFGEGTATPYVRHTCVKKVGTLFIRMKCKIEWKSTGERPVEAAAYLFAPDGKHDFYLKALSKFAHRLMHEGFVDALKAAEERQILGEVIDTVS